MKWNEKAKQTKDKRKQREKKKIKYNYDIGGGIFPRRSFTR